MLLEILKTEQRVGFQLQIEWLYLIQRTLLIIY